MGVMGLPSDADVTDAAARIGPYARRTPVLRARVDGRDVAFKLEHLQASGAFKVRGALNALLSARPSRVVTASGGNHGLGVATAAHWLDIPATVFVPETVPAIKASRIASAGAQVVRVGTKYADAEAAARTLAASQDAYYVHAYDDPHVVAGQSTLGLEIAQDLLSCDVVAVPVGGGGLFAGVSAGSSRRVIGVEPEGCACLHAAVEAGKPVDAPVDSVASSALGASRAGELALQAYRVYGGGLALVSDEEILAAQDRLWEEFRIATEPAAAVAFAAWLAGHVPGELACLVVSGANAAWAPQAA
jgi:threonine dehydratase